MLNTVAKFAAEELARMMPEARAVAIIKHSIVLTDENGAAQMVVITDEILKHCEDLLLKE